MSAREASLGELARTFLRLGTIAFGGPAAHIALMRQELVVARGWLSDARFLDLLSAANLIPGPNSTELAIHIGYERRRIPGLLVAGISFIAPAALMTGALGAFYVRYGRHPAAEAVAYGVRPVMLAIVLQALWGLVPRAASTPLMRLLGMVSLALALLGVDELMILLGAGIASLLALRPRAASAMVAVLGVSQSVASPSLASIFGVFLKIGATSFGSGYVLLSLLRGELVATHGWLDERTLLDAIVIGQVTPGPLFTSATFIGYLLRGAPGALVATLGIFLPAFVLVASSSPFVAKLRASASMSALLDGVNVASLALMAAVLVQTSRTAIVDLPTCMLAIASAVLTIRTRLGTGWLVLGAAALGLALKL